VPSEKESGVALNIAIIMGVSFSGSGVVVGMIGTNDSGCRARRTETGSLSVEWTNVGEILFISLVLLYTLLPKSAMQELTHSLSGLRTNSRSAIPQ